MKNLFVIIAALCLMLSVALSSDAAGSINGFRGGRPSYSGFRSSSPSYHSFSSSPSRTFTFRSSTPAPSRPAVSSTPTYSRPSTTPRTYSYSPPAASPTYRNSTKTTVHNHYHDGSSHSGGGLSLTDYMVLHSLTSWDNSPTYVNAQPVATSAPTLVVDRGQDALALIYQEKTHYFRNTVLTLLGLGLLFGVIRYWRQLATNLN